MAQGLHEKPPNEPMQRVIGILLICALAIVVVTVIGAADHIKDIFGTLPFAKR